MTRPRRGAVERYAGVAHNGAVTDAPDTAAAPADPAGAAEPTAPTEPVEASTAGADAAPADPAAASPVVEPTAYATDEASAAEDARVAEERAAAAAARSERERKRLRQTVRDMILSMAVVAGVVLVIFQPWGRSTPDPVRTVDPAPVISAARTTSDWPVLAPEGLPATWRATSARFEVAADGESVLQTGYLSPSTMYVGLAQSKTKETAFVRERSGDGEPAGSTTVAGVTWDRLESADGKQRSLVRVDDGVTYVVTGQAEWPEIEAFAAKLRAG